MLLVKWIIGIIKYLHVVRLPKLILYLPASPKAKEKSPSSSIHGALFFSLFLENSTSFGKSILQRPFSPPDVPLIFVLFSDSSSFSLVSSFKLHPSSLSQFSLYLLLFLPVSFLFYFSCRQNPLTFLCFSL